MGKAIPDRWLNYRPIGERVAGTRFIAFKVPLLENINKSIGDEELRLAPHSLLQSVPNLGLIVDLTNTNRYYNPQIFTDLNVEHQKLKIPGHHTPTRELAQRFCKYVSNFLEANSDNDKLIGVHCTHGVNRTGYLICYFMITKMNMVPKLAIQTFADARGHKIERENYTDSLQRLTFAEKMTRKISETNSRLSQMKLRRSSREETDATHREERHDARSDNWRDRQPDQYNWQEQKRPQWRESNWDHSQDKGWRQQPQRWRQEASSDRTNSKRIDYNEYQAHNERYQEHITWEPRQTSHHRENEDQSYSRSSNYSDYSRNNSYHSSSKNDNYNNCNDYSRDNNYSNNNYSRGNNYGRGNNYSRGSNFSRGNHINRGNHHRNNVYSRDNSYDRRESRTNRFQSLSYNTEHP